MRRIAVFLPAIAAGSLHAQDAVADATATATAPSFVGELAAILVPLALIIVALLVVLRLARRRFGLTGQDAPLSVLQILPVGPRERLVLVKTRSGEVFAIGVGAQTVTFIREFDPVALGVPGTDTEAGVTAEVDRAGRGWGRMHRGLASDNRDLHSSP